MASNNREAAGGRWAACDLDPAHSLSIVIRARDSRNDWMAHALRRWLGRAPEATGGTGCDTAHAPAVRRWVWKSWQDVDPIVTIRRSEGPTI